MPFIDLTGKTFGRLHVIKRVKNTPAGDARFFCVCQCGETPTVLGRNLRKKETQSCGCYHKESVTRRFTTHGLSYHPLYSLWQAMIQRCTNPNAHAYTEYGGRGITVCKKWLKSLKKFHSDMKDRPTPQHSLDRIDNDGPYSKKNCRWATKNEQQQNRRNTIRITFHNKHQSLFQWALELNIPHFILKQRLSRGWSIDRAFTQPPQIKVRSRILV